MKYILIFSVLSFGCASKNIELTDKFKNKTVYFTVAPINYNSHTITYMPCLPVTIKDVENYADNYYNFKYSLQDILKHPIDLLEERAIQNIYFRKSIDPQKKLIYEN